MRIEKSEKRGRLEKRKSQLFFINEFDEEINLTKMLSEGLLKWYQSLQDSGEEIKNIEFSLEIRNWSGHTAELKLQLTFPRYPKI